MKKLTTKAIPGDVRAFRMFEDFSGVSALVDVRVDGQVFTYSASFLGTEAMLWLISNAGTRTQSKRAAKLALDVFTAELLEKTTPEYREATRVFYATPDVTE